jgi:RimJ/RimL family protein N-acetyltransferase
VTTIGDLLPALSLQIAAGPLELRGIGDDDLAMLCDLAAGGIHPPERMPFYVPWTDAPAEQLGLNTAQYHWRVRASFSVQSWVLPLGVWHEGVLVGSQALVSTDYLVTRTAETGSWLGRAHQGRGIGTAMRRAICAFAFDCLDAQEVTSGAFTDNPASLAVSRKVGYRANGTARVRRRDDEPAVVHRLRLLPEDLRRGEHPITVTGLDAFRRSIGLDTAGSEPPLAER